MSMKKYLEADKILIITIASVIGIIIMILSVHLLYQLFCKLRGLNRCMKALCAIFSMAYIPLTITNILTETESEHHRKAYLVIMNACYNIVNVALYLIIVLRFHDTFTNTIYQSSTKIYTFLFVLIIIYFLSYTLAYTVYAYNAFHNESRETLAIIFTECLLCIIDMILSIIITYLFCNNLFKLTVSISSVSIDDYDTMSVPRETKEIEHEQEREETADHGLSECDSRPNMSPFGPFLLSPPENKHKSSSILSLSIKTTLLLGSNRYYDKKQMDNMDDIDDEPEESTFVSTLDLKQHKLIAVATRLMILTIPAVITTTLVWTVSIVLWISLYRERWQIYYGTRWVLHVFILPMDAIANFLCVYLNFQFSRTCYNRLCCGIHRFCENCWAIVTMLKLEQMRASRLDEI